METRYDLDGALYPQRAPPGVDVSSAAGSMAMAVSLLNHTSGGGVPNAHVGHNATLLRVCASDVLNCTFGDRFAFVYEIDISSFPYEESMRDDFGTGVWLLSVTIEPVVHLLANDMLMCLSTEICDDKCSGCPVETIPVQTEKVDALTVVQRVEAELAGGGDGKSRDVLSCVRQTECLSDVAKAVAMDIGARASLSVSENVAQATTANGVLIDTIQRAYDSSRVGHLFNETLKMTHEAARAHEGALAPLKLSAPAWTQQLKSKVLLEGRRAQEESMNEMDVEQWDNAPKDPLLLKAARRLMQLSNAPLKVIQMRTISNATCAALEEQNYTRVIAFKQAAIVQWTMLGAQGN